MCLGAVSGDWVDREAPRGIFSLVSGVCYIFSAFLEAGGEEETSTPPALRCCWMVWNCRSCRSGIGQVNERSAALLYLALLSFFLGSLLWKRWKGGPGNLSGQRIQTSNSIQSVYHYEGWGRGFVCENSSQWWNAIGTRGRWAFNSSQV